MNQSAPACFGQIFCFDGRARGFGLLLPVWLLGVLLLGCGLLGGLESQWFRCFKINNGGTKSPAQYLSMTLVALYFLNVESSNLDAAERKSSMETFFF
jgi:hypothetical protein